MPFCALAGLISLSAAGASGQDCPACLCPAPVSEAGGVASRFIQVSGNVKISQPGKYAGGKPRASVHGGARIMTGAQSSASLRVGSDCAIDLPANAMVKVDLVQAGTCVSLNSPPSGTRP
jgi:hypothetical protein